MSMDYMRQVGIFNPEEQALKLIVIGAGSTGSFVTLNLAKLGFNDITCYDFDKIEAHNIPNQFYRIKDIGKYKVEALKEIVKEFTGVTIDAKNEKVINKTEFDIDLDTIVVLCLDSLRARKTVFNLVKELPIKLIDVRMGGEGFSIQVVDLSKKLDQDDYIKSLNIKTKDLPCGQKSIIYCILNIASEVTNIIKRMDKDEKVPKLLKREMTMYKILIQKVEDATV